MNRVFHKKTILVALLGISSISLFSCTSGSGSGESSSKDLRTYSFLVNYYDDINQKVGYDYVAYNQPSRVVRKIDSNPFYDYRPHKDVAPEAGKRLAFDSWQGNYDEIDPSLPPYSENKPAPAKGDVIDINHIKGPCSFYPTFKKEIISYKTRFYNGNELIKEGGAVFDEGKTHSWGEFVTLPETPSKVSRYGYKNDFLGYVFSENGENKTPFASLESASFYSGEGEPSKTTSFFDESGKMVSPASVAPGSFYEDCSSKDANGYYTLDLYGFDGEWNYLASLASDTPKISYYARYKEDEKIAYDIKVFRSYEEFENKANPIRVASASYATQIKFSEDKHTLIFTKDSDKTNIVLMDEDHLPMKTIRKWMGVFASDESVIEQYRGKLLSDEYYVFAPLNLFPISMDCKITLMDSLGEKKGSFPIAYGNKISINDSAKTVTVKDAEDSEKSIPWNDGGWKATYSEADISLPESLKGQELSLSDAIVGDIILQEK